MDRYKEQLEQLAAGFKKESERGQILIAAAILDKALEECLIARFDREHIDKKTKNKLLSGDSALFGSFWAKIIVCRAFGLINDGMYDGLEAIRKLRNCSAHSGRMITLSSPEAQSHMETIHRIATILATVDIGNEPGVIREFRELYRDLLSHPVPSDMFQCVVLWIHMTLVIGVKSRATSGQSFVPIEIIGGDSSSPQSDGQL